MQERIDEELALLRSRYPNLEYAAEGRWVRIPDYPVGGEWNRARSDVAFQIHVNHPGSPPYGLYVPVGLLFKEQRPNNYTEPAGTTPPFPGTWGIFSWTAEDGQWQAKVPASAGANLLNWALGFARRFSEGV